jgi:hypothetical protein
MNTSTHQKEILLVANASFFSKNWVKRNEADADKNFTAKEKLIDACWNGIVPQLLPECFDATTDEALTLCSIMDTRAFIDLDFWDFEIEKENEFSLNPYIFMELQSYN